jgi:hypothetical protein
LAAASARAKALKQQADGAQKRVKGFLEWLRRSHRNRGPDDVEQPRKLKWLWISLAPKYTEVSVKNEKTGEMERKIEISWPKGTTLNKGRNEMKRKRRAYEQSLKGPSSSYERA